MATVTQSKIQIRTDEKPVTFTTIEIGNVSKDQAERIQEVFKAKPGFMNFEIIACPYMGSWVVSAETKYNAKKDEILGQFLFMLATAI